MTDFDPLGIDPEMAQMLRPLRFERDQEAAERLVAKQSDMRQVSMTAMMAGEVWNISFCQRSFDGHVVHVGDDFVGLSDRSGNLLDVRFESIDYVNSASVEPNLPRAPTTFRPATFRGRLLALQEGRPSKSEDPASGRPQAPSTQSRLTTWPRGRSRMAVS